MEYISRHITLDEVIRSETARARGINNMPGPNELKNIRRMASDFIEPLRLLISSKRQKDTPLFFSSFYRSPELNKDVGGAGNSAHKLGLAVDIDLDNMYPDFGNRELFKLINENKQWLEFDQLIWEYGNKQNPNWIHIGLREHGLPIRRQVFAILKGQGVIPVDWV